MPLRLTLRLVPVAAGTWAVALCAIHIPDAAPALAGVLWLAVLALLAGAAARSRRPGRRVAGHAALVVVLALGIAAAAASHVASAQPARDAGAARELTGGRAIEVAATVVGKVERRIDGALAFDALATRIETGEKSRSVLVEIVVRVAPDDVSDRRLLDVGAVIVARGTASASRPGERAVLVVSATRGVDVRVAPAGVASTTAALRQRLVAAAERLPGHGAGLVPGLAVGDTSAVDAELDTAMKESSLSHLTAVSGANCALVVGLAFAAAAAAGARRSLRVASGLVALVGFVVLVTPEPSVVRAGVMAAVAMLGVLLGRPGAGMAILSLAVGVLLVVDPWLAGSLGFALSSVATASLLLFARPLAGGLARGLPRALALALAVPLAAQLACGPLLVLIAPQVPVYGVVANLLAAPAAPVATVIGLAACLSAPLPWLQDGLAALAWVPASWIAATATTISALPGDLVPWLEGWPGAAALGAVGLAVGLLVALRRSTRPRRAARLASAVIVAVVAGIIGGGGLLTSVAGRWTLPSQWSVLACDVGQGDAVLLRSGGVVALVDTGPAPEPLTTCLDRAGIDHLDLLVLTHFDLDHAGGVPAVVGRVGTVLHGPALAEDEHLLYELAEGGARMVDARAGVTGALGAARWRVVWPPPQSRAFTAGNDASVILDVRGGGIPPTLLLGDLSASPQRALVASGALDPPYAIVKVAHHGSADQDAALYATARPAVALVTVGADNDYGHPREEILSVLSGVGARIARTDVEGIVALWGSETGVAVWRERGG
ncbi:ComEC/Rec2 family competence protein [Microbacterium sp. CFBP9034]|uniref:ComEC/Rec2 family competence protein n=1 Tax=Microbacterium sp. CFBP9034 TaxID=3096540 RepID=UPI002A6B3CE7|nr:ComEC/Rec2 family competence protein [Microbacterium sp. CFBP9034]MDY0909639.1 ComEC/Rec2 family competence protein [Microbacterium sp. CFBP9034]